MFQKLIPYLTHFFERINIQPYYAAMLSNGIAFVILLVIGLLLMYLARFVIKKTVYKVILKSESKYDDQVINNNVLMRLCLMIPAVLVMKYCGTVLPDFPEVQHFFLNCCIVYVIVVITMVLFSVVNTGSDIYNMHQTAKMKPMNGLVQTIKIILIGTHVIYKFQKVEDLLPLIFDSLKVE